MITKLSLMLNAMGAGMALGALWFACHGANVTDCLTVALSGLAVSVFTTVALFWTEPEAWA